MAAWLAVGLAVRTAYVMVVKSVAEKAVTMDALAEKTAEKWV